MCQHPPGEVTATAGPPGSGIGLGRRGLVEISPMPIHRPQQQPLRQSNHVRRCSVRVVHLEVHADLSTSARSPRTTATYVDSCRPHESRSVVPSGGVWRSRRLRGSRPATNGPDQGQQTLAAGQPRNPRGPRIRHQQVPHRGPGEPGSPRRVQRGRGLRRQDRRVRVRATEAPVGGFGCRHRPRQERRTPPRMTLAVVRRP